MLSFCVPNLFVMHTKCEGAAIYFALCHDYRMMPANGTISFDSFRVTPAMTLIAREMLPQKHLRKLSLGLEINSKEALKDHVVSEVFADAKEMQDGVAAYCKKHAKRGAVTHVIQENKRRLYLRTIQALKDSVLSTADLTEEVPRMAKL